MRQSAVNEWMNEWMNSLEGWRRWLHERNWMYQCWSLQPVSGAFKKKQRRAVPPQHDLKIEGAIVAPPKGEWEIRFIRLLFKIQITHLCPSNNRMLQLTSKLIFPVTSFFGLFRATDVLVHGSSSSTRANLVSSKVIVSTLPRMTILMTNLSL